MATAVEPNQAAAEGTEINEIPPFPDGIHAMKCESDGKLYVINEILNFYQRKLSNLDAQATKLCAHHLFELEAIHHAKNTLLNLWNWRKCQPSTENTYIIKGLETKRQGRNGKTTSVEDIVNFLSVEDANLGIIFLTLECEKIPSKVTESEAMKDIYVLMHESDSNYQRLMSDFHDKSEELDNYKKMVTELRADMNQGFLSLTKMLRELPALNNVATATRVLNAVDTNVNGVELATSNDMASEELVENTNIGNQVNDNESPQAEIMTPTTTVAAVAVTSSESGTLGVPAAPTTEVETGINVGTAPNSNENELEPGEIPDEDGVDNRSESSFTSAAEGQNENP